MRRDLYAEVSARIIEELEQGAAPWIKPWSATAGANTPCNAVTNRPIQVLPGARSKRTSDRVKVTARLNTLTPKAPVTGGQDTS
jgi:hypothetical protein